MSYFIRYSVTTRSPRNPSLPPDTHFSCGRSHVQAVASQSRQHTNRLLVMWTPPLMASAVWSSGMILAQGARGPGFNSRNSPFIRVQLSSETWMISVIIDMATQQCRLVPLIQSSATRKTSTSRSHRGRYVLRGVRIILGCRFRTWSILHFMSSGNWCSGITPAQHAGGPGFNPLIVHCYAALYRRSEQATKTTTEQSTIPLAR